MIAQMLTGDGPDKIAKRYSELSEAGDEKPCSIISSSHVGHDCYLIYWLWILLMRHLYSGQKQRERGPVVLLRFCQCGCVERESVILRKSRDFLYMAIYLQC